MSNTEHKINEKIYDHMTQLQVDLERALKNILEQAGSKINLERQQEVKQQIEDTKQLIERMKSRYV
ncbi:MAG: hypothetical protein DSM106950_29495 [Stigonema ocellatum SAG 48.90 = DSM 106950]|nr:hypothetical protein [Stigonema ocellatum SAG 48.90 = DSM 106950]